MSPENGLSDAKMSEEMGDRRIGWDKSFIQIQA